MKSACFKTAVYSFRSPRWGRPLRPFLPFLLLLPSSFLFHPGFVSSIVELTGMLPGTFCLFLFRGLAFGLHLGMIGGFAV
ncbi:hypothetical protein BKA60DRAFT_566786 [Fusarium oxysporum]|nr:hypothetical protein BKA60DRAFT_566786 [Fusarium oxysporum]